MSDFTTLQTALSGLLAHRRAMEVIGHNIANANTDGFTRRTLSLKPVGSTGAPAVFARSNSVGEGVDVVGVTRLREEFLDIKMRIALGAGGSAGQVASVMNQIEGTVPEPSDTGIAQQLSEFSGAWDDAAANPGDVPIRTALLEQGATLASTINRTAAGLTDIRTQLVSQLSTDVDQLNADARSVAGLNTAIIAATASGSDASDLQDQRDLIIDRMGRTAGVTTRQQGDGSVDVFLGGSTLVRGGNADGLKVVIGGTLDPPYAGMPLQKVDVRWISDGYPVNQLSGEVAGKLVGIDTLVPQYLNDLDGVASRLVSTVNALHATGHGLAPADVNLNFFDPAGTTAATISVSTDVAGQPSRIALAGATGGALDGSLGHAIGGLVDSPTGAGAAYRSFIGRLGVDTQTAVRRSDIQTRITTQVDSDRKSATGVSLDEEMTSLVATQRAFEASSRVLTAVDQLLDQLINRTGMVGR